VNISNPEREPAEQQADKEGAINSLRPSLLKRWPQPAPPLRTPREQVAVLLTQPDAQPKGDLLAKRRAVMAAAMHRDTATRWPFWCLPDSK
jgi:hypothetical protein